MSERPLFCPVCDYNLTGAVMNRCSECGEEFDPAVIIRSERWPIKPIIAFLNLLIVPFSTIPAIYGVFALDPYSTLPAAKIIVIVLGVIPASLLAWYVARRLAVTRAAALGWPRSGTKDSSFTRLCFFVFLMWQIILQWGAVKIFVVGHMEPKLELQTTIGC